mmetsp:Transcript_27679/g.63444  ORF Transcript_27679/g.63444 Transcript_27679/m.63444 type:complete len:218 (-) Transcript_27679:654-1307(-)
MPHPHAIQGLRQSFVSLGGDLPSPFLPCPGFRQPFLQRRPGGGSGRKTPRSVPRPKEEGRLPQLMCVFGPEGGGGIPRRILEDAAEEGGRGVLPLRDGVGFQDRQGPGDVGALLGSQGGFPVTSETGEYLPGRPDGEGGEDCGGTRVIGDLLVASAATSPEVEAGLAPQQDGDLVGRQGFYAADSLFVQRDEERHVVASGVGEGRGQLDKVLRGPVA